MRKIRIWVKKPTEQSNIKVNIVRFLLFLLLSFSFFSIQKTASINTDNDLSVATEEKDEDTKVCYKESETKSLVIEPLDCSLENLKNNKSFDLKILNLKNHVVSYSIVSKEALEVVSQENMFVADEYQKFNIVIPIDSNEYYIEVYAFSNAEQKLIVDALVF